MPNNDTPYVETGLVAEFRGADAQQLVVLDTDTPHLQVAVATTATGGLQTAVIDLSDQAAAGPVRATDTRFVADLDSFLSELTRRPLNGTSSALWGEMDAARVVAIYDEHTPTGANWREDRLALELADDVDWRTWHQVSGKWMGQNDFSDVVEELLHTVVSPDQAELLEVIASVRASTRGEFEQTTQRANGSIKTVYSENVTTKAGRRGELEVPEMIEMSLTPWEGHDTYYKVQAYLRLNVSGGDLKLCVKLKPTRQIKRRAWADLVGKITEELPGNPPVLASTGI